MIKARFLTNSDKTVGFIVSGHAGYAESGHDIVCAGVSASLMLTVNAITENFGIKAEVRDLENEIFFKGSDIDGIVVAEIKSVEEHPESKKLHLLKVDAGDGKLTDVVCGAPNVRLGMKTAFAKVGATIGEITIAPRPLAGFESFGMCCSEAEIGISDDNSGIMDIDPATHNGTDVKRYKAKID